MGYLNPLRSVRQRLGELSARADEIREIAVRTEALALATAEHLHDHRVAAEERHVETQERLGQVQLALHAVAERLEELAAATDDARFRRDVIQSLRWIQADEPWHRRQLRARRETAEYQRAYSEAEPLISVVIATYDNLELLRSRALPSILAQTYRNFEIVIVGDASAYSAEEVTAGFDDAPIRFTNLTARGHFQDEPYRRWLMAGTSPFNEAIALARGLWIAPFADDDAMRAEHLETLLRHAVENRLEFTYGLLAQHDPDKVIGTFPPRFANIGLQAALLHRDLDMFEFELADADFGVPNDWGLIERMLRAGVRAGMVEQIVADYYPSKRQQAAG